MNVQSYQIIVYPALLILSLLMAGMLLLTWAWLDRRAPIMALTIYFLIQAVEFTALTLATGTSPVFDINDFLVVIVSVRGMMVIALFACVFYQTRRILRRV